MMEPAEPPAVHAEGVPITLVMLAQRNEAGLTVHFELFGLWVHHQPHGPTADGGSAAASARLGAGRRTRCAIANVATLDALRAHRRRSRRARRR